MLLIEASQTFATVEVTDVTEQLCHSEPANRIQSVTLFQSLVIAVTYDNRWGR